MEEFDKYSKFKKEVGLLIKDLRKTNNLSHSDFININNLNISASVLELIENGQKDIYYLDFYKLIKTHKLDVNGVFEDICLTCDK